MTATAETDAAAFPAFGDPLPIRPCPAAIDMLARRRSSPAQSLGEPGPTPAQLELLLRLGARVPDHGKLAPWRFLVITQATKPALLERLEAIARSRPDGDQALAKLAKLRAAPLSIAVISRVNAESSIAAWEQELSAGAVCMSILVAAAGLGLGANWITDWYAYDAQALGVFGLADGERLAGVIHVGTPPEPPRERARPELESLISYWTG